MRTAVPSYFGTREVSTVAPARPLTCLFAVIPCGRNYRASLAAGRPLSAALPDPIAPRPHKPPEFNGTFA